VEFVEHQQTWARLRKHGVVASDGADKELHLDLDDSTPVEVLDVAAHDHPRVAELPPSIRRVPRAEMGPIVEGIVHKLRLPEVVVIPVGRWRHVFEAVAKPMSAHEHWREIDAAATVELNTRDPLSFEPAHHHLLRDLVSAVVSSGGGATQGISVVAVGMRIVLEVLPDGQMIVFVGDAAMLPGVAAVIDHHSGPR
jgi:hypothetical protein